MDEKSSRRCAIVDGTGNKNDDGKDPWHLLPTIPIRYVVLVLGYGAQKYGAQNWRRVQGWRDRYYSAGMRHILAWWQGEWLDPESKLPHLAHAICCLLFLLVLSLGDEPEMHC